jgi:hypothetical protein
MKLCTFLRYLHAKLDLMPAKVMKYQNAPKMYVSKIRANVWKPCRPVIQILVDNTAAQKVKTKKTPIIQMPWNYAKTTLLRYLEHL